MTKPVLIIENCNKGLTLNEDAKHNKKYLLEGSFTVFDKINRNQRVYTANEFIPHVNEMMDRKKRAGAVFGEFDHPSLFDTSLQKVSHVVENAWFDKELNSIQGQIVLLSTYWGKEARAIVEDGYPLFVSSRAAGVTENNGQVKLKKLFTYDCVAEPGFEEAKMNVVSMNESYGFSNDSNFRIYEMDNITEKQYRKIFDLSDESKTNQLFEMNKNDNVTKKQLKEYSDYLVREISTTKSKLNQLVKENKNTANVNQITQLSEYYDNLQTQNVKVAEYLDYLAEHVKVVVQDNERLKKRTSKLIKHNDYLAEQLEKSIANNKKANIKLNEKIDSGIKYSEYIVENVDNENAKFKKQINKITNFTNYLAENIDQSIQYSEHIANGVNKIDGSFKKLNEKVGNSIRFSEYIAEHTKTGLEENTKLNEKLNTSIKYGEYLAKGINENRSELEKSTKYSEYLGSHINENKTTLNKSIKYSEYVAECADSTMAYADLISNKLNNKSSLLESKNDMIPSAKTFLKDRIKEIEKTYIKENDGMRYDTEIDAPSDDLASKLVQAYNTMSNSEKDVFLQDVKGLVGDSSMVDSENIEATLRSPEMVDKLPALDNYLETSSDYYDEDYSADDVDDVDMYADGEEDDSLSRDSEFSDDDDDMYADGEEDLSVDDEEDYMEEEEIEHVMDEGRKYRKSTTSITNKIDQLILEAKRREASKEEDPHFYKFLNRSQIKAFESLSDTDREDVISALNETKYFSAGDIITTMRKVLSTKEVSPEEKIIQNMPKNIQPIWEKLDSKQQNTILAQSKFYVLDTEDKVDHFWKTRKYSLDSLTEKTLIDKTDVKVNETLTDDQIKNFMGRFNSFL